MKKPKGRIAISVPQLSSDASSLNYQSGRCTQTLLLGSVSSMKCQSGCFSPNFFFKLILAPHPTWHTTL